MSFTVPLPPRTQLYHRSCSNKHTHSSEYSSVLIVLLPALLCRPIRLCGKVRQGAAAARVPDREERGKPCHDTRVRDERTHPHRPRLVVYHSTCRPLSSVPPPPPANSFVIGPAVINTHTRRSRCHLLESVFGPCGWQSTVTKSQSHKGDTLVRVDGFDCKGVIRNEIKRRVLGTHD